MNGLSQPAGIPSLGGAARIVPAANRGQIERIRELFREYADSTGACECFEGFGKEIAGLPGPYRPPAGQLLLAEVNDRSVGCVALRQIEEGISEMKRLYVRPAFRSRHLGRHLAEAIITDARRIGYRAMRLDTLSSMVAAHVLYRSLGFRPIPRYNDNPESGVIHLELKL